ncbi:MAG: sulfatase-like hydrolase/transferase, partial [Gemmataceae bacterium]|nr:sulfatase-like hydrolase/transferase [Gemmataceae bacterium]
EDTIVVFSSDNGPHREGGGDPSFFQSAGPLRGFKRSLHDGGVRVPFVVCWPGRVKPGSSSDHIGAFWDFLPTAVEVAGGKTPDKIDGISFLPTLLGKEQKQHDFLYWEFFEGGFQQAARMGKWKAIRPKLGGPLELYDLEKDIGETTDIAARHADVVARIEECLRHARTESPFFPVKKGKK